MYRIGIGLIIASFVVWIIPPLAPFLPLSAAGKTLRYRCHCGGGNHVLDRGRVGWKGSGREVEKVLESETLANQTAPLGRNK